MVLNRHGVPALYTQPLLLAVKEARTNPIPDTGFIPFYLEQKGVTTGNGDYSTTYRNYAIQAVCGIPASLLGGFTVELKRVGRKGTGAFACICTGVFLFLYTRATSAAGVLGFSCAIAFFQNLVYGLLYSYTPELFPVRRSSQPTSRTYAD